MKARFIWEVRLVMIHVKQSLFFRLHLSVRTRLETCVRRRGGLAVSRTEFVVLLMLALLITFLLIKARVLMVFETLVFRTFAVLSVTVLSVEAVLSITFFAFEMLLALLAVSFPFVLLSILAVEAVLLQEHFLRPASDPVQVSDPAPVHSWLPCQHPSHPCGHHGRGDPEADP